MSPPKAVSKNSLSNLDTLSFAKYMKDIGRAYRKQAMELITICRTFVQVGERSVPQDAHLRKVLEVVDDALSSAAETQNKTSKGTDKKVEDAVSALSAYEQKFRSKQQNSTDGQQIAERMKSAKENDKSSSGILSRLKRCLQAKPVKGPTKVARFLLPGSLSDPNPKVIEQMLGEETSVPEILWNFGRLKGDQRITLKQHPHFYRDLPTLPRAYNDGYTTDAIVKFWDETEIWVLTDKQSRVFLETGQKKRVFGNFWVPDGAIIFKDISGRLEGERIVAADIRGTPHLWRREEPPVIPPLGTPNPSSLRPIITNPVMFEDWRQLVRDTLKSPNVSICISAKSTPPESPDDWNWVLSSPTIATPASPALPFSTMQTRSKGDSSGAKALPQLTALRIPEPSPGPLTTLTYKTARSGYSPVPQTPQTVRLPPFSTSSAREPSAAAPPSTARPTPVSQDSPVAVSFSMSRTVVTHTPPPQARPLPSATPQRPEPSTGEAPISSRTLATGSIASSPPSATLTSSKNDLARSSGLHAGDGQVGKRTSVPESALGTSITQALGPGQQQAESATVPVKGPAQTQGKKTGWFQKIRKYFWE